MNISSFLIGYQAGKNTGGGSSADVRYVTFMSYDGTEEYGKKAVAVGDDCADPIARGLFSKPTRESTAQYDYTHYGWATTPNGGADANWNKAITEDKTVYANFSAVVRYYTITYYDGDTLLKTETLAYGSVPDYSTEKKGFNFEGWSPVLTAVTCDASYYAQWSEAITFAGGSWEDILDIVASGKASSQFSVGDTKSLVLTDTSGNTETITVAIAGFDHDDLADGSGKASVSIVCLDVPSYTTEWYSPYASQSRYMYAPTSVCTGDRDNSKVNVALQKNGDIWNMLPTVLKNAIKPVLKYVNKNASVGGGAEQITQDLWALSLEEMNVDIIGNDASRVIALGQPYELFPRNGGNLLAVTTGNNRETTVSYWTRSVYIYGNPLDNGSIYCDGTQITSGSSSGAWYRYVKWDSSLPYSKKTIRFGFCI